MIREASVFFVLLLLSLLPARAEIEITFSNEQKEEQIFLLSTRAAVERKGSPLPPSSLTSLSSSWLARAGSLFSTSSASSSSGDVISLLRIMKGEVVLLEKLTSEIGKDGFDIDIDSDLLDIGENELNLFLLSANGTVLQSERIMVLSPPPETSQHTTVDSSSLLKKLQRDFKNRSYQALHTFKNSQLGKKQLQAFGAALGTAVSGAFMYARRQSNVKPSAPKQAIDHKTGVFSKDSDSDSRKDKAYSSKFPKYPLGVVSNDMMSAVAKRKQLHTSIDDTACLIQDILIGKSRNPNANNILLRGGAALWGVQVASRLAAEISKNSKFKNHGNTLIGTSKKRKPVLGQWRRKTIANLNPD